MPEAFWGLPHNNAALSLQSTQQLLSNKGAGLNSVYQNLNPGANFALSQQASDQIAGPKPAASRHLLGLFANLRTNPGAVNYPPEPKSSQQQQQQPAAANADAWAQGAPSDEQSRPPNFYQRPEIIQAMQVKEEMAKEQPPIVRPEAPWPKQKNMAGPDLLPRQQDVVAAMKAAQDDDDNSNNNAAQQQAQQSQQQQAVSSPAVAAEKQTSSEPSDPNSLAFRLSEVLVVAASGILQHGLPLWVYCIVLNHVEANVASFFLTLIPVFGITGAFFVLGESLSGWQWTGALIIVASGYGVARLYRDDKESSS
jgi:hypothetical protein